MALVLTNHAHQKDMIADWPWRQIGLEPNLQYLNKYWYFLILDEHHHPFYNALMLIYSELEVIEKPRCSLSQKITGLDFWHLWFWLSGEKNTANFWPCRFWPHTLSTFIESWGQRAYLQVNKGEFTVLLLFTENMHEISPVSEEDCTDWSHFLKWSQVIILI